jgi:hypothetical protein
MAIHRNSKAINYRPKNKNLPWFEKLNNEFKKQETLEKTINQKRIKLGIDDLLYEEVKKNEFIIKGTSKDISGKEVDMENFGKEGEVYTFPNKFFTNNNVSIIRLLEDPRAEIKIDDNILVFKEAA